MIKANHTEHPPAAEIMRAYAEGLRDGQRFTVEELRVIVAALELSGALQDKLGTPESLARCERALLKAERILEAAEERT